LSSSFVTTSVDDEATMLAAWLSSSLEMSEKLRESLTEDELWLR